MSQIKKFVLVLILLFRIHHVLQCKLNEGVSSLLIDQDSTSCKADVLKNEQCQFICKSGYTESVLDPVCLPVTKDGKWNITPTCTLQSCGSPKKDNIYKFSVNVKLNSTLSNGNFKSEVDLKLYYVSYDATRKLPQYTITLQDSKAKLQSLNAKCDRSSYFIKHPCTELAQFQVSHSDFTNSGYDRGHLVPNEAMCFAQKAAYATFLLVNIAAQDPTTNRQYWRILEERVSDFSKNFNSIVLTGVCNDTQEIKGKLYVPTCYWKLICSKITIKKTAYTVVFGFQAENSIIQADDVAKKEKRDKQTKTLLSKNELFKLTRVNIDDAWINEAKLLVDSQNQATSYNISLPDPSQCKKASGVELKNLNKNVLDFLTKTFA